MSAVNCDTTSVAYRKPLPLPPQVHIREVHVPTPVVLQHVMPAAAYMVADPAHGGGVDGGPFVDGQWVLPEQAVHGACVPCRQEFSAGVAPPWGGQHRRGARTLLAPRSGERAVYVSYRVRERRKRHEA